MDLTSTAALYISALLLFWARGGLDAARLLAAQGIALAAAAWMLADWASSSSPLVLAWALAAKTLAPLLIARRLRPPAARPARVSPAAPVLLAAVLLIVAAQHLTAAFKLPAQLYAAAAVALTLLGVLAAVVHRRSAARRAGLAILGNGVFLFGLTAAPYAPFAVWAGPAYDLFLAGVAGSELAWRRMDGETREDG